MELKNIISIVLLILFTGSCIEPYKPNITKYENVFVVDGEISNLPGPYFVRLSRSFEFDKLSGGEAVTGALLKIIENTGREIELSEISAGVYSTVDSSFQGIPGNNYKLQINLDNEVYESEFETIKDPVPIDSVYWRYKVKSEDVDGIQFYLDTHDPTNSTHYYSWEYVETWKFRVPIQVNNKPEWWECFKDNNSSSFNIATSTQRKGDIIEKKSINFIGENTEKLMIRYSILVKQYALNEQAYKFFSDLITLNQDQGTLFDPIPYSLVGNMKNVTNKDLPVLGYFLVAGASEERIFIDRSDLPREYTPFVGYNDCASAVAYVYDTLDYRSNPIVDSLMKIGYSVYEKFLITIPTDTFLQLNMAKAPCYNCTLSGYNKDPEFWTEKEDD